MSKTIKPKDIISHHTVVSGATIEKGFGGFYKMEVFIQDYFATSEEAQRWQMRLEQFILENRPKEDNQKEG